VLSGLALGADLALPPAAGRSAGAAPGGRAACFGWWNFVTKANLALAAGLALPLLALLGYSAGRRGRRLAALSAVYAFVPLVLKLGAAAACGAAPAHGSGTAMKKLAPAGRPVGLAAVRRWRWRTTRPRSRSSTCALLQRHARRRRHLPGPLRQGREALQVVIDARWKGDTGTLDERFTYSGRQHPAPVWTSPGWTPTATPAGRRRGGRGERRSPRQCATLEYVMALPVDGKVYNVDFDDWMFLMDDRVMLNRSVMSKFGFPWAKSP
jgi:hypothetical protein